MPTTFSNPSLQLSIQPFSLHVATFWGFARLGWQHLSRHLPRPAHISPGLQSSPICLRIAHPTVGTFVYPSLQLSIQPFSLHTATFSDFARRGWQHLVRHFPRPRQLSPGLQTVPNLFGAKNKKWGTCRLSLNQTRKLLFWIKPNDNLYPISEMAKTGKERYIWIKTWKICDRGAKGRVQ